MGEGGIKNSQKNTDIFYGRPLSVYQPDTLKSLINKQGGYVVFLVLSEYSFIRDFRVCMTEIWVVLENGFCKHARTIIQVNKKVTYY